MRKAVAAPHLRAVLQTVSSNKADILIPIFLIRMTLSIGAELGWGEGKGAIYYSSKKKKALKPKE